MSDELVPQPETITEAAQKGKKTSKIASMTPEERKEYQREASKKTRKKKADRNAKGDRLYNSPVEISKKAEAIEVFGERGITNQQVASVLFELAQVAAQHHDIPVNHHLLRFGLRETLAARTKNYEVKEVEDAPVIGELLSSRSLDAIWDYTVWPDPTSFEEFLRVRHICKTDAFELGKLLGKDFEECCQGEWTKFLPRFNPDTLPSNYTQKEMRLWLDSISPVKDYLLMASRNSMKSSFSLVWLLTLHLCCPDARALLVSETQKLSAGFIRSYRSYWERKPHQETVLTKYFPEYCIPAGTGTAKSFESPMAHLDLIQGSAEATSMESVVAGGRAEVLLFDDPISNLSCGTEEQRQKSVNNFDLLQKLREVLGSFSITIGTPWYADEDLYAVLLQRNEAEGGDSLSYRIDPVVRLKPHALHKLTPALLPTLTEEDIESYLLPVRMPWRFVKKEIAANPTFALSQNFCIFPTDADADIKVQFDEHELRSRFGAASFFEGVVLRTVMALDRAYSVQRYADYSCIVTGKVMEVQGTTAMVIPEVILDRLRESELAVAIVKAIEKHNPAVFVAEKDRGFEELWAKVKEQARLRSIILPTHTGCRLITPLVQQQSVQNDSNFRCRTAGSGFTHRRRWMKSFVSSLTMTAFASPAAPLKMTQFPPSRCYTNALALVPSPKSQRQHQKRRQNKSVGRKRNTAALGKPLCVRRCLETAGLVKRTRHRTLTQTNPSTGLSHRRQNQRHRQTRLQPFGEQSCPRSLRAVAIRSRGDDE
jgi:hypothetical protein